MVEMYANRMKVFNFCNKSKAFLWTETFLF